MNTGAERGEKKNELKLNPFEFMDRALKSFRFNGGSST